MAIKTESLVMFGILIFAIVYLGKAPEVPPTPTTNGGIDLCKFVESEASLTGQRMFLTGTALTSEWARVIKTNDDNTIKDKGQISMDSGTTDTKPRSPYKIYFGENSSTYYTQPMSYTAPCDDATDDKTGVLCTIDTTPTLTAFDEYGRPMSDSTNAQAMSASEVKDITVRVKVSADQCYGNPYAGDKKNAICFKYNSSTGGMASVVANTETQDTPYIISANNASTGYAIDCYELNLLKDTEYQDITVTLTASDSYVDSDKNNVTAIINDMAFDLDADTLDEIWGFEDEDNNELGTGAIAGVWISIS